MTNLHSNATPNMVFTGAKDNPRKGPAPVLASFGNFTTLNFIKSAWGSLTDALAVGDSVTATRLYGAEAFDINQNFYNYQTCLATGLMAKGVAQFLLRVASADAKKSGARLMLEYVEASIDPMERNLDGTYKLDVGGLKIASGTPVDGYLMRLLVELSDGTLVTREGTRLAGTLVGKPDKTSVIVPIADLEATYKGTRGNRLLTSLFQPKATSQSPVDIKTIEKRGTMIYRMGVRELTENGGSSVPWYTVDNVEHMDFTLEPKVRNVNGSVVDFETMYRNKYTLGGQITNGANITGPVDGIYWYKENIEEALALFHAAEKAARVVPGDNTIWIDETNPYSINLFGSTNHKNLPYRALNHAPIGASVADARQVVLAGGSAVLAMAGGNDGDLSDAAYNAAIRDIMDTFGMGIPLGDIKHYPFKWVVDTGLEMATTKSLYNILATRPDVAIMGATHEHGHIDTMDETSDKAIAIYAAAGLIPESVIYSTPATRGAICPYAIRIKGHQYNEPISLNYRVAMKMADYLGSGDLVWNVDRDPMAEINKNIEDTILNYEYKPYSFREKLWAAQAIAIESTGHNRIGLMGLQSINPNDSSSLNSLISVAAVLQATWAMAMAHGAHCGGTMTPAQIIKRCNATIEKYVKGIDSSKAIVIPDTQVTPEDYDNAFSYTMRSAVQSGNQFTAATITIDASYFSNEA